jgi:hypothetical protein
MARKKAIEFCSRSYIYQLFKKENEDESYTEVNRQFTFHSEFFAHSLCTGKACHRRPAGAAVDRK